GRGESSGHGIEPSRPIRRALCYLPRRTLALEEGDAFVLQQLALGHVAPDRHRPLHAALAEERNSAGLIVALHLPTPEQDLLWVVHTFSGERPAGGHPLRPERLALGVAQVGFAHEVGQGIANLNV